MIRLLICEAGDAKLKFEEFDPDDVPSYAILSHTWLDKHEGEVSYHDLKSGQGLHKSGWTKIDFCAKQALSDGFSYFWVDTCCIDKRNERSSLHPSTPCSVGIRQLLDAMSTYRMCLRAKSGNLISPGVDGSRVVGRSKNSSYQSMCNSCI